MSAEEQVNPSLTTFHVYREVIRMVYYALVRNMSNLNKELTNRLKLLLAARSIIILLHLHKRIAIEFAAKQRELCKII